MYDEDIKFIGDLSSKEKDDNQPMLSIKKCNFRDPSKEEYKVIISFKDGTGIRLFRCSFKSVEQAVKHTESVISGQLSWYKA